MVWCWLSENEVCNEIPYEEAKYAGHYLEDYESIAKLFLVSRAEQPQPSIDQREVISHALQPVSFAIELRKSVTRTMNYPKQLR